MFFAPLFSDARVDQNFLIVRFDEEAIHVHANAILIVRRINAGPEVARHDSEHRAAIESELTVGNNFNPVIAEKHRVLGLGLSVYSLLQSSHRPSLPRHRSKPKARHATPYFFPLGGAGFGFAPGAVCGGASSGGIIPGGIPCCICCGGGCGTEKFSAIVMWLP